MFFGSHGARLEQLLVYPLAGLTLGWSVLHGTRKVISSGPLLPVVGVLLGIIAWTTFGTFVVRGELVSIATVVSHLENYAQPVAVILLLGGALGGLSGQRVSRALEGSCRLLIALVSVNAVLAFLSAWVDMTMLMRYFAGAPDAAGLTVWEYARHMGRYSGVFNQPIEAGVAYSIGLFCWIYLRRVRGARCVPDYGLLYLIFLGGLLTVSKAFVVVGLALAGLYWIWTGRGSQGLWNEALEGGAALAVLAGAAGTALQVPRWREVGQIWALMTGWAQPDALAFYTADRLGKEGTRVQGLFEGVWDEAPILGLGFGAVETLDSGYGEFFVQGGVVALAGYVFLLLLMGGTGVRRWRRPEGRFLVMLVLLAAFVSVGGPVVTANRAGMAFWVLATLIYSTFSIGEGESVDSEREPQWA